MIDFLFFFNFTFKPFQCAIMSVRVLWVTLILKYGYLFVVPYQEFLTVKKLLYERDVSNQNSSQTWEGSG